MTAIQVTGLCPDAHEHATLPAAEPPGADIGPVSDNLGIFAVAGVPGPQVEALGFAAHKRAPLRGVNTKFTQIRFVFAKLSMLREIILVDLVGIEPTTSSMP